MRKFTLLYSCIFVLLIGCTKVIKLKNEKQGELKATKTLEVTKVKIILLDSDTAPTPQYTQMFKDSIEGVNYFTFLNIYNNSIYFYDYNSLEFIKKITYDKRGPDGILQPLSYHIKNMDSIYVYNKALMELFLTNSNGQVLAKKSLIGDNNLRKSPWFLSYPQYNPETVTPFIETSKELLFTGQSFTTVNDTLINKFKFTAYIDYKLDHISFSHTYPKELYGFDYNWIGDLYTKVFVELHPDGDKLIFSFPVSHDLYIADIHSNAYHKVYAGSNEAGTNYSINKRPDKLSSETIFVHYAKQNDYAAIKYDKFREVYYRFFKTAIPNPNRFSRPNDKFIGVIIMDKNFNYLGEKLLGTGKQWYWQNSFVTKEGLNIEYMDNDDVDEVSLTLKIFTLKKI